MFLADNQQYAILCQEWYMPRDYKNNAPPDGRYVLWSCCIPWPCENYEEFQPPKKEHYVFSLRFGSTKKKRRVSPEGKASIRLKRLQARINKKYPLFAEQALKKAIDKKPDYFNPEKIAQADVLHRAAIKEAAHKLDMLYVE